MNVCDMIVYYPRKIDGDLEHAFGEEQGRDDEVAVVTEHG